MYYTIFQNVHYHSVQISCLQWWKVLRPTKKKSQRNSNIQWFGQILLSGLENFHHRLILLIQLCTSTPSLASDEKCWPFNASFKSKNNQKSGGAMRDLWGFSATTGNLHCHNAKRILPSSLILQMHCLSAYKVSLISYLWILIAMHFLSAKNSINDAGCFMHNLWPFSFLNVIFFSGRRQSWLYTDFFYSLSMIYQDVLEKIVAFHCFSIILNSEFSFS